MNAWCGADASNMNNRNPLLSVMTNIRIVRPDTLKEDPRQDQTFYQLVTREKERASESEKIR